MPKSKLTFERIDTNRSVIRKKRGKLTLDEIEDFLRYEENGIYNGCYLIILNCSEATCEGSGWPEEESPGDCAELLEFYFEDTCPVCTKLAPPEYCPACGEYLFHKETGKAVNPEPNHINAKFVSVWDGGISITTTCKIDLNTKMVYEIELSEEPLGLKTLEREYIIINDSQFPVHQKAEANPGEFWYE